MIVIKTLKEGVKLNLNGFLFQRDVGEPPVRCEITDLQYQQYKICFEDEEETKKEKEIEKENEDAV